MSSINPSVLQSNLLLYYDFANVKSYSGSGTTVNDISKNGNTGTLVSGPVVASNLCSFDGVNDYIGTPLTLPSPITTPTTFEVIFKNNSASGYKGLLGRSAFQTNGFSVGFSSLSVIKYTCSGSGIGSDYNANYDSSVLSHLTSVFNGRNIDTYRNGVFVSTITMAFDIVASPNNFRICDIGQGGWGTGQVDISLVRVYNTALSSTQILQNYNALKGRYGL